MAGQQLRDRILEALFGVGGLLRVRSVLTYILVGQVGYLTATGRIDPAAVVGMAAAAVAFYFASRK